LLARPSLQTLGVPTLGIAFVRLVSFFGSRLDRGSAGTVKPGGLRSRAVAQDALLERDLYDFPGAQEIRGDLHSTDQTE
jgi:hypothetical protein